MSNAIHSLPALLLPLVLASAASAQTVTVTTITDVVDIDGFAGTVADLPGPDGLVSFSEAMIATNNTPGHQTVAFAIPATDLGWCCPAYDGIAVFHSVTGFYWRANDEVTIDGTTQTAFAGDTNPNGAEILLYGATFYLNADNSTLRGFHSTAVQSGGVGSVIEDNTGGMNLDLFAGGASLVRNNVCGTIKIDRSSDNVVIGNTASRVRIWGFGASQPATGNRIGGPTPAERNYLTGYGTWNSDGYPSGTTVELFDTTGTVIENNSIGTTPDGLAQGNLASTIGIGFSGTNVDTVVRGNRIAGILGHGQGPHANGLLFGWAILVAGSGSGLELVGNTIGLDANGQPTLGSVWGIDIGNPVTNVWFGSDVRIGGSAPGEGNEIAGHSFNGITVGRNAQEVRIEGNSIHDNGWLGIDLIPSGYGYGVTPNDALDLDTGGNALQNFPELLSATVAGPLLRVLGTLHSTPSSTFTVEFFGSSSCDGSGNGEGEVYLGTTTAVTDAAGNASFDFLGDVTVPAGWVVTASAIAEPTGATSEFSACVTVDDATVGIALCTGEGVGSTCPCGNDSLPGSGEGCANSTGVGARLHAWGSTVAADDELTLLITQAPPSTFALFFQGSAISAIPFLDGSRCSGAPLVRLQLVACDESGAGLSTTSIVTKGGVSAGQSRAYQAWYRDMAGPCSSGGNVSSALRIDWQ